MQRIFISYRREDTAGHAGRLFDRLRARFGKDAVFMDVEGIEAGVDFVEAIERAVGACDVLLAVIGRSWLDCKDALGRRRLEDAHDFISLETATALKRGIRVIPVLVEGAPMPPTDALPETLRPLTRRQAVELRDNRWEADVDHLVQVLENLLASPAEQAHAPTAAPAASQAASDPGAATHLPGVHLPTPERRGIWLGAAALILGLGLIGYQLGSREPPPPPTTAPAANETPQGKQAATPAESAPTATESAPSTAVRKPAISRTQPAARSPQALTSAVSASPPPPPVTTPAIPVIVAEPSRPAVSAPSPSRQAPAPAPTVAATPPIVAEPPRALNIAVVALGETTWRAFWSGEKSQEFTARMANLYQRALREHLSARIEVQVRGDSARAKSLIDGDAGIVGQLCANGTGMVYGAVAQQAFAISQAESAHWPELRLAAYDCASGRRHDGRYNLSPHRDDTFPFARDMTQAMTAFIRDSRFLRQ